MKCSVLTLFPELFTPFLSTSIIGRAIGSKKLMVDLIDLRAFSTDKHQTVDDTPYGGGPGMVLRVDIIDRALEHVRSTHPKQTFHTILLDAAGHHYAQGRAQHLTHYQHLVLICGHYEGVDERVRSLVDEVISIGEYVLTGGELPAMIIVDSVARLLPGVLGNADSSREESYSLKDPSTKGQLLEYPTYTRPEEYKDMHVPNVLLSGDHKAIAKWRLEAARKRTKLFKLKRSLPER